MGNLGNAIIYMRLLFWVWYCWFKGKIFGSGRNKEKVMKNKLNKRILK